MEFIYDIIVNTRNSVYRDVIKFTYDFRVAVKITLCRDTMEFIYDIIFIMRNALYRGITYSMAQQPLMSFDHPLIRASLSNSILVTLIFY